MKPTTLYRLYDSNDRLLYVGIAGNPGRRFEQHASDKPWWREVARTDLEHFDSREGAATAERKAISAEGPLHNVAHNNCVKVVTRMPRIDPVAAAYRSMARIGYRPEAPSDGAGTITVPLEQLDLMEEVSSFVERFRRDDDRMEHWVGCAKYSTSGLTAMAIEVARILNGGDAGNRWALAVLREMVDTLAGMVPAREQLPHPAGGGS